MKLFYTPQLIRKRINESEHASAKPQQKYVRIRNIDLEKKAFSKSLEKLDKENVPQKGNFSIMKSSTKSESREALAPTNGSGFQRQLARHSYYVRDLHTKALLNSKTILVDMFVAASVGDVKLLDFYLRVGQLPVDAADNRGWRAIHHACLHAQTDVVAMLVQKGASINVSTVSGLTPILLAGSALTPRYDVIKILIQNGANLESKTPLGTTVLMDVAGRAYEPETEELCYMLLRSGADLKQKDNKGRTAVDYAMSVCNMDVLKTLKNYQSRRNRSPRH